MKVASTREERAQAAPTAGARRSAKRTSKGREDDASRARPRLPTLNPILAKEALCRFIQHQVRVVDARGVVVGLSGGIDSGVAAALSVAALGPDAVQGLVLPSPRSQESDRRDALAVAERLSMRVETVPLATLLEAYADLVPNSDRVREGNFTARLRMALLYDRSHRDGALVVGTSNKTELLLGYATMWGDVAAAFAPLGDLYKTQVRILARALDLPEPILGKAPSAGLWAGQTDEEELGATYEDLDSLLYHYVDLRYDLRALVEAGFEEEFARDTVARVHAKEYKRRMPLIPKLSTRSVGHDFLYPRHWPGPDPNR